MLELKDVHHVYPPNTPVLAGVDLSVSRGELVVLRGPSGAGKTTLLLAAGGLRAPSAGRITVDGEPVGPTRWRGLGFVFQTLELVPYLSALENVRLAGPPDRARGLLDRLGLGHRLHHRPEALSAGERRRAAVARALAAEPALILADEPTGSLDEETDDRVFAALEEARDGGAAVLIATHVARHDARADRVVALRDGRVV